MAVVREKNVAHFLNRHGLVQQGNIALRTRMKLRPFTGTITAMVTPFRQQKVAFADLSHLVEYQIKSGINGLVPVGTTGESPTMSHEEHMRVVELCVEAAAKRVPVIAGTGSNSTSEAITLTKHAKKAGAAACLVVTPYYNKPTQEGLYQHYKAIAESTSLPIVLYNIPQRVVLHLSPAPDEPWPLDENDHSISLNASSSPWCPFDSCFRSPKHQLSIASVTRPFSAQTGA